MFTLFFIALLIAPTQINSSSQPSHRQKTDVTKVQNPLKKELQNLKKHPDIDIKAHSTISAQHDYITSSNDVYGSGL